MTNKDLTKDSYPYVTGMGFRNKSNMIYDEFLLKLRICAENHDL